MKRIEQRNEVDEALKRVVEKVLVIRDPGRTCSSWFVE